MPIANLENYFRAYDKNTYSVFAQQGNEPSAVQLETFEAEIGFRLPDDFRAFALHPLGGLYIEVKESLWPRAERYAVGPFWSFLRGFFIYSLSGQAPEWMQIRRVRQEFADAGHANLVPFLKVIGDTDPYCFTSDGRVVIHRHETPDDPETVTGNFGDIVMKQLHELEERKNRKLAAKK